MQLKLSCYCCGCEEFEHTPVKNLIEVKNRNFLLQEFLEDNQVKCTNCGLEDYIMNLPIKFS